MTASKLCELMSAYLDDVRDVPNLLVLRDALLDAGMDVHAAGCGEVLAGRAYVVVDLRVGSFRARDGDVDVFVPPRDGTPEEHRPGYITLQEAVSHPGYVAQLPPGALRHHKHYRRLRVCRSDVWGSLPGALLDALDWLGHRFYNR